jgi:DNA-binding XRE family transcriptional regulator
MTGELAAEGFPMTMLVADMCRLLNCHENTLYARIKAGQVPAYARARVGASRQISQQTYSKYESGKLLPDIGTKARIAAILGTLPDQLWPVAEAAAAK